MFEQIVVCVLIGLGGMSYLIGYEHWVMVPFLDNTSPYWVGRNRLQWVRQRDSVFSLLWPGVEEAVVRGIPMLLITNRWTLAATLVVINVGFALGHPDTDVIGPWRTLVRFATGLVFLIPAVLLYNLYLCYALHALWNLSVTIRRWNHDNRDRVIVWTAGPLEILLDPGAESSHSLRWIFRKTRTVRAYRML